ncbi:MAG: HAMP domain-containing histidine kinase [Tyzzerella sp.]|nr:HAMP domain-containing histidine kinase [Tyzzerella sp.]
MKSAWEKKYRDWKPEQTNFYHEWLGKCILMEKRLVLIGAATALLAYVYIDIFKGKWWIAQYILIVVLVEFIVCQIVLLQLADEKMNELMGMMAEITQKRIEEALEIERKSLEKVSRSDQLRIDLITNVSHDLKTPLTSIVGYLELMKKEELSDVVRDYVEVISERADKLKEMIGSLFSLAKASSGNVELHMEKFEVNRLLEQILADMKDRVEESGLDFVTQFTEENTELITDNMYFYRICQNLIENTLKYSAKGTRVFVKTYMKEGAKLCMEIVNTASYFMDFEKEDILERFARADKARSTDGNGLGLAIVSTYAKTLGGEFDIRIDCDQFKAYLEFPKS